MHVTYRMLGREHEADLEREAAKWRRAAEARGRRRPAVRVPRMQAGWAGDFGPARLIAYLMRVARVES